MEEGRDSLSSIYLWVSGGADFLSSLLNIRELFYYKCTSTHILPWYSLALLGRLGGTLLLKRGKLVVYYLYIDPFPIGFAYL